MMKTLLLAALALLIQSPLFAQDDGAPADEAAAPAEAPADAPAEMAPPQGDGGGEGGQSAAPQEAGEDYSAEELAGDQSAPVAAPAEEAAPAPQPKAEDKKPAKKVIGRKSKTADPSKGPPLPAAVAKADRPKTEAIAAVPLTPVFPNNP